MPEKQPSLLDRLRAENKKMLTVSELTANIRSLLEGKYTGIWVCGETSNLRIPSSGHCYFTLKDEGARIAAVIWRSTLSRVKFEMKDGMKVALHGSVTVYEPRGDYQVIVDRVEPLGVGALELAFRQLREKLEGEGLFDAAKKKPIPFLPHRIGIVTSPTGAALQDILNVTCRRFPNVEIILSPVRVQGGGAREEIAAAINYLNFLDRGRLPGMERMPIDVLIVGRGGGSLEDLQAFNEEVVARAIYASDIPVISAVGHEIDFTIADFVADIRALTPSEAGEKVVPRKDLLLERMASLRASLAAGLRNSLTLQRRRLDSIASSYAFRAPEERVRREEQRLDDLSAQLYSAGRMPASAAREKIARIAGRLDNLSPLRILSRGYSVTTPGGADRPITRADEVGDGDEIETRLRVGRIRSRVTHIEKE